MLCPYNAVENNSHDVSLVRLFLTDLMMAISFSHKIVKPIFLGMLLGGLAVFAIPMNAKFSLCGFHWLTGMPCPLCGMTRALSLLLKGHWELAWRLHPLSPVVLSLLLVAFLNEVLGWILPKQFPLSVSNRVTRQLCLGFVICFSGYGIFRLLMAP